MYMHVLQDETRCSRVKQS